MVGYGPINKEQMPTVTTLVGLGLAGSGMKLMHAPIEVALGFPIFLAGVIVTYKGLTGANILV
jgi:hypothetical protein